MTDEIITAVARLDSIPGVRVQGVLAVTPQEQEDERELLAALPIRFPYRTDPAWRLAVHDVGLSPPVIIVVRHGRATALLSVPETGDPWRLLTPYFGLDAS